MDQTYPVLYLHGPHSFLQNLAALREMTFLQSQRLICDSILIQQVWLLNSVVQFWTLWLPLLIHLLVSCHWNAKIVLWTPVFQRVIAGRYTLLGEKEYMDLVCGYVVNFLYISKNMNCCFLGCNARIVGWMFPIVLKEGIAFILMGPVHQEDDAASSPTRPQFSVTLLWKPQTLHMITFVHHSFWNTYWGLKDCQRFTFD
jgi:hypothetical protein